MGSPGAEHWMSICNLICLKCNSPASRDYNETQLVCGRTGTQLRSDCRAHAPSPEWHCLVGAGREGFYVGSNNSEVRFSTHPIGEHCKNQACEP